MTLPDLPELVAGPIAELHWCSGVSFSEGGDDALGTAGLDALPLSCGRDGVVCPLTRRTLGPSDPGRCTFSLASGAFG